MKYILPFILFLISHFALAQNDYSIKLDGNDYVKIGASLNFPSGSDGVSISIWVKDEFSTARERLFEIGHTIDINNRTRYSLSKRNDYIQFFFEGNNFSITGGTTVVRYTYDQASLANRWVHIVATAGQDHVKLYIDGNLVAQESFTGTINHEMLSSIFKTIGVANNFVNFFADSYFDETALWNTELTAEEITTLHGSCPTEISPSYLRLYYDFNSGTGNIVYDQSGYGHNGALVGNPQWSLENPDVSCCSDFTLDAGESCFVVYNGYDPMSCTDLTVSASGGTTPYTYKWNTSETTQTINVCPTSNQWYTVTITDANGCELEKTFEVKVVDVHCGNNGNKVKICHNGNNTICVNPNAVEQHLIDHGDVLGDCGVDPCNPNFITDINDPHSEIAFQIYPNPASDYLNIKISNYQEPMRLQIFSVSGLLVKDIQISGDVLDVSLVGLHSGVYHVSLFDGTRSWNQKLVVLNK